MESHHAPFINEGSNQLNQLAWNSFQLECYHQGQLCFLTEQQYDSFYLYALSNQVWNHFDLDNSNFKNLIDSNIPQLQENYNIYTNLKKKSVGFVIPKELIQHENKKLQYIYQVLLLFREYPVRIFLESIASKDILNPAHLLLSYWKGYCLLLKNHTFPLTWFGEVLNLPLENCDPFAQLFILLFQKAEAIHQRFDLRSFNRNLQLVEPSIIDFFKQHEKSLTESIQEPESKMPPRKIILELSKSFLSKDRTNKQKSDQGTSFIQRVFRFQSNQKSRIENSPEETSHLEIHGPLESLNALCNPLFSWKKNGMKYVPKWNVFKERNIGAKAHQLQALHEKYQSEQTDLDARRKKVRQFYTSKELTRYFQRKGSFSFQDIQSKWNYLIQETEQFIKVQKRFRLYKMKELGIISDQEEDYTKRNNLWLNEMLQVEQEISSYIPFVKEAFKSALPIRKRIVYDSNRTIQEGIEFDPLSVFDHEKWLRAEVMKAMRQETALQEIEQINCFCLDLSGSMYHEKMRNLFKVLYLIILALEDRKSYDAFHFFSNRFIEGLNFTEEYTSSKLLFPILKKIAKIQFGEVKYEGLDGTNMSSGISKCIKRVLDFEQVFRQHYVHKNVVLSLFVISDGRPSMGITDLEKLNIYIQEKRLETNISIKGIYIKENADSPDFISEIFGADHCVETDSFEDGVHHFVKILTETYKNQRKDFRWKLKMKKLHGG